MLVEPPPQEPKVKSNGSDRNRRFMDVFFMGIQYRKTSNPNISSVRKRMRDGAKKDTKYKEKQAFSLQNPLVFAFIVRLCLAFLL